MKEPPEQPEPTLQLIGRFDPCLPEIILSHVAGQWDNREEPRQLVGRCPSRRYLSRVGQWRLLRLTRRTRPQTARPLPSARAPRRDALADAGFARLGCATRCHRVRDGRATRWRRVARHFLTTAHIPTFVPHGGVECTICLPLGGSEWQARATTQECTQIAENGLSAPFWGICVHCCAVVDRREDAGVYTDRRKWPLRAGLGRLCTLLRRESQYESRRELRQVARAPQPPRRAGGVPSLAPLAWSGRQALSEWRRCQVGIFAEASTHTNP